MAETKLLIIHHGALGDVVTTFPAIFKLRQSFGCIDALFQGRLGKLAAELKVVDNCFALEAAAWASLYSVPVAPAVKNILRTYDSIVLFSHSRQLQETINNLTGNRVHRIPPRPDVDQPIHVLGHVIAQLADCGLIETGGRDHDVIACPEMHSDKRSSGYNPAKVCIHPGSGSKKKNWKIANYLKTARILEATGMRTEFILGPAEHFLAESLQVQSGPKTGIHIVDDLSALASLLKTAGGFIGNDSGISHLAAFLGLATVAVFGPSDPQRWKPVGRAVKALRPVLECSPCFETDSTRCASTECLDGTTPEAVVEAFYKLVVTKG
uniref:Glycosyltransferase family 9 protein n=1 Tax=Candidatus Desulfatibia profunda TaxID=2841695 RepID=A0A8J6TNJ4_9BACT|nr:glycosyltransferase family 9 protein [Candidatus Desulfatibia profunda]